jgi:S-adenosylmethionine:tRNA ribosyltransferase-isomerase
VRGSCEWRCIVGNSKKWKEGPLEAKFCLEDKEATLKAFRVPSHGAEQTVRFEWVADMTFGQLLEHLGRTPIPPYLGRDSQEIDDVRYQTVSSRFEGSVAAPTAGLHFSETLMEKLRSGGVRFDEITLHVGAGTFLPVKSDDVSQHDMHTEHFEISVAAVENLMAHAGRIVAVGTTTVRTVESLAGLGYRIICSGDPDAARPVGQWELYDIPAEYSAGQLLEALAVWLRTNGGRLKAATRILIVPGFRFRVTDMLITNFHQPKSTLLLLVSAFVGEDWRKIYEYALAHDFRFLSYGDSSLLVPPGSLNF